MQRVGKRLNARRASPGMAFALAQRRNTAGSRDPARSRALASKGNRPLLGLQASTGCSVPTRPQGASQRIQSGVAVLAKGNGHSLRTAPCLESSGTLCIHHYYLDRVLEAGLGFGGAAGLLGGLLAITFPPAGLILGSAAVVATTLAGAGFGALISGLVASDMPNHTIEKFAREIEAGNILLLVDVPRRQTETYIELIKSHHASADIRVTVRPGH